jgi:hypothetical protein
MSIFKRIARGVSHAIKDTTLVLNSPITNLGKAVGIKKEPPKASGRFARGLTDVTNDISVLAHSPIKNATNSVRGRAFKNDYKTGVGKFAGKISDTSQILIDSVSKGFVDALSGGGGSKLKNWAFKTVDPKNKTGYQKESMFKYGEMKPTQSSSVKWLDKAASYAPAVGAVAGAAYGAYAAGSSIAGGKDKSNMKPNNTVIGNNVLSNGVPQQPDTALGMPNNGLSNGVPAGVQPGDIPGTGNNPDGTKMAFGLQAFKGMNPIAIGLILVVIVLMVIAKPKNA